MARLKHFRINPPGGWRYVEPSTAARFTSDTFEDLLEQVRVHRKYKGIPFDDLAVDIETQMCSGLTEEWCRPAPGESYHPVKDLTAELTSAMAVSLTKSVAAFLAGGAAFVPKEEAESRAAICRGCPFNKPSKLCACSAVYTVLETFIPKDRRETGVSVCMACGCSLQAKVNLPAAAVAASLAPDLVLPSWCWQEACRNGTPAPT
jgi:hypothetical protein